MLLIEFRKLHDCSPVEETVFVLHQSGLVRHSLEKLSETMKTMIDDGSRYRNIEKVLGVGSALLLGNEISETS